MAPRPSVGGRFHAQETVMVGQLDRRVAPASSSSVQRARPSPGSNRVVAMRRASSLLGQLTIGFWPRSSFRAASRLPLTKRRLVL